MRIYKNFKDATDEIKRDLAEMGILVHPHSYQNKIIEGDPNFDTLELQNYIYTVTQPNLKDLDPTQPWADAEFEERIYPGLVNPGEAWKIRPKVWEQFLTCPEECGELPHNCPENCHYRRFDYTYNERMKGQIKQIIKELKKNPDSRQLYMSIWDKKSDPYNIGGNYRIPCSLGYLFQARQGQLHMTYLMRSSDFATHFQNDVYLAYRLQRYVAGEVDMPVGRFTHYIASLHLFRKDAEGVF